jgi:hypothetical protein
MGSRTTMSVPAREKFDARSEIETQEPSSPGHE